MADDIAGGASLQDLATAANMTNQVLSLLVTAIQDTFPRVTGSFTCAAAATTTVTQINTTSTSVIVLMPTNAAAGTLMAGLTSLYTSARTSGASFTVATANAAAAAGTETFSYIMINPS